MSLCLNGLPVKQSASCGSLFGAARYIQIAMTLAPLKSRPQARNGGKIVFFRAKPPNCMKQKDRDRKVEPMESHFRPIKSHLFPTNFELGAQNSK
jgi:hypothetical protein